MANNVIEAIQTYRTGKIRPSESSVHTLTLEDRRRDLFTRFPDLGKVPQDRFPNHMLIIPDGNGRWAERRHQKPLAGHEQGKKVVIQLLRDLRPLEEIKFITLWGMSADNLDKRDSEEKENLFRIFGETLHSMTPELLAENGRFMHIGRKDRIPQDLRQAFDEVETLTAENTGQTVCLAVDYGGEDQELRIMQRTVNEIPKDTIVTIEDRNRLRDGGGILPSADMIIRTSGEERISDLGWLGKGAEFIKIKELFPTIGTGHVIKGLIEFSKRERRGGGRPKTT